MKWKEKELDSEREKIESPNRVILPCLHRSHPTRSCHIGLDCVWPPQKLHKLEHKSLHQSPLLLRGAGSDVCPHIREAGGQTGRTPTLELCPPSLAHPRYPAARRDRLESLAEAAPKRTQSFGANTYLAPGLFLHTQGQTSPRGHYKLFKHTTAVESPVKSLGEFKACLFQVDLPGAKLYAGSR